jgi:hypothetical protein
MYYDTEVLYLSEDNSLHKHKHIVYQLNFKYQAESDCFNIVLHADVAEGMLVGQTDH